MTVHGFFEGISGRWDSVRSNTATTKSAQSRHLPLTQPVESLPTSQYSKKLSLTVSVSMSVATQSQPHIGSVGVNGAGLNQRFLDGNWKLRQLDLEGNEGGKVIPQSTISYPG